MTQHTGNLQTNVFDDPMFEAFNTISDNTWGDPVYGTAATSIVQEKLQKATGGVYAQGTGLYFSRFGGLGTTPVGEQGTDSGVIRRNTELAVAKLALPCETTLVDDPDTESGRILTLVAGPITPEALGNFAGSRNYDTHQLNGTLGKALDIILSASERLPTGIDPDQAEADGPFIPTKTLYQLAGEQGLAKDRIYNMALKIDNMVYHQIRRGKPTDAGELVIEGKLRTKNIRTYTPEHIAVHSLDALANMYKGGQSNKTVAFLRQVPELF